MAATVAKIGLVSNIIRRDLAKNQFSLVTLPVRKLHTSNFATHLSYIVFKDVSFLTV